MHQIQYYRYVSSSLVICALLLLIQFGLVIGLHCSVRHISRLDETYRLFDSFIDRNAGYEKETDRDMNAILGNIYKKDIDEIWNSPEAQTVRNKIWEANEPYCHFCDRYNKVNQDFSVGLTSSESPIFL